MLKLCLYPILSSVHPDTACQLLNLISQFDHLSRDIHSAQAMQMLKERIGEETLMMNLRSYLSKTEVIVGFVGE